MVNLTIVFTFFLLNIVLYIYFSKIINSWINVLTPQFIISTSTLYLPEYGYLLLNKSNENIFGYLIIYSTYALINISFILGYLVTSNSICVKKINLSGNYNKFLPITILLGAFILYFPILYEFSDIINNTRGIYEKTRSGYGLNYFLSSTLTYISLATTLFCRNIKTKYKILLLILMIALIYLHGSKGQLLVFFFILITFYFIAQNIQIKFEKFVLFIIITGIFGFMLFYMTIESIDLLSIFSFMIGYSDYSRNAVMLFNNELGNFGGSIILEDNFYSRIPRMVFASKPDDYGSFGLAKKYFPYEYYLGQGFPSFGIGIYFADFTFFAIPILTISSFFSGFACKLFKNRVIRQPNPFDFILLLYFMGIGLIPIGFGILLPEHFFLVLVFFVFSKLFIKNKINVKL